MDNSTTNGGRPVPLGELDLLGCILWHGALGESRDLRASDFISLRARATFLAMLRLESTGREVDPATLTDELARADNLPGGMSDFVERLIDRPPVSGSIAPYVDAVRIRAVEDETSRVALEFAAAMERGASDPVLRIDALERNLRLARSRLRKRRGQLDPHWQTVGDRGWLDTDPPEREWLLSIDGVGVLATGVVGVLGGQGGIGKSLFLTQLGVAVATGRPFFGMHVGRPGGVVLGMAEEPDDELHRRLRTAVDSLSLSPDERRAVETNIIPMGLSAELVNLLSLDGKAVCTTELHAELLARLEGAQPSLVVLDPLARWGGAEFETSNAAATSLVHSLELFTRVSSSPTVLVAHHNSKEPPKGERARGAHALRGSSALADGVRWAAELTKEKSGLRFRVTKANNAPDDVDFHLRRNRELGGLLEAAPSVQAPEDLGQLDQAADRVLDALNAMGGHAPSERALFSKMKETGNGMKRETARAALEHLVTAGKVTRAHGAGTNRGGRFRLEVRVQ
jgi:hypothetical protein